MINKMITEFEMGIGKGGVNAPHSDVPSYLVQDLFEKTHEQWKRKNPNKPMPWSYWNPIFRKAGILGAEAVAVYDEAYPPTQSNRAVGSLRGVRPEGSSAGYGEVLFARRVFYGLEHASENRAFRTKGEWISLAKRHGISEATRKEVWRDRNCWHPLTVEENLVYNQTILMHELGHASVAFYCQFPIKGIGIRYLTDLGIKTSLASGLVTDLDAVSELAREQTSGNQLDLCLTCVDGVTIRLVEADLLKCLAGALWEIRAIQQGLLPEWYRYILCPDCHARGDLEQFKMLLGPFPSALLKEFEARANRILNCFDVVKSWQRAGEVVQQHDVRLGRPTRSQEIFLSREETEDAVKMAWGMKEPTDYQTNIYSRLSTYEAIEHRDQPVISELEEIYQEVAC